MERSRTWECRFPIGINERALNDFFRMKEIRYISNAKSGGEALRKDSMERVIENYKGEDFLIHFRCELHIQAVAKILAEIGGQLSITLQQQLKEQAAHPALALFHLFYFITTKLLPVLQGKPLLR